MTMHGLCFDIWKEEHNVEYLPRLPLDGRTHWKRDKRDTKAQEAILPRNVGITRSRLREYIKRMRFRLVVCYAIDLSLLTHRPALNGGAGK